MILRFAESDIYTNRKMYEIEKDTKVIGSVNTAAVSMFAIDRNQAEVESICP